MIIHLNVDNANALSDQFADNMRSILHHELLHMGLSAREITIGDSIHPGVRGFHLDVFGAPEKITRELYCSLSNLICEILNIFNTSVHHFYVILQGDSEHGWIAVDTSYDPLDLQDVKQTVKKLQEAEPWSEYKIMNMLDLDLMSFKKSRYGII